MEDRFGVPFEPIPDRPSDFDKLVSALDRMSVAMHAYAQALERWTVHDAEKDARDCAFQEKQREILERAAEITRKNFEAADGDRQRNEEYRQRELAHMEKCEARYLARLTGTEPPERHH